MDKSCLENINCLEPKEEDIKKEVIYQFEIRHGRILKEPNDNNLITLLQNDFKIALSTLCIANLHKKIKDIKELMESHIDCTNQIISHLNLPNEINLLLFFFSSPKIYANISKRFNVNWNYFFHCFH